MTKFVRLGASWKSSNINLGPLPPNDPCRRVLNRSPRRSDGYLPIAGEIERKLPRRMKSAGSLHFKTFLFILLMVIFGPLGNVLLGKGMKRIGALQVQNLEEAYRVLERILSSVTIWAGIASLLSFFVAYMLVLSWADYSYVQPASSVSYAMVAVLAHYLLHEAISPLRWAGVLIICLGVLVVGYTPPRTTEPN